MKLNAKRVEMVIRVRSQRFYMDGNALYLDE